MICVELWLLRSKLNVFSLKLCTSVSVSGLVGLTFTPHTKTNNTSRPSFSGVVSLASNIVVLLMFVKFKELRTATNFIIINLAFTDIGVAGIGYPMSAASDIHGSWKFGYTGCQVGGIKCVISLVKHHTSKHKNVNNEGLSVCGYLIPPKLLPLSPHQLVWS